ncbi:MAG: hypothetical protein ACI38U_07660, partial [Corynebacterium sp.]
AGEEDPDEPTGADYVADEIADTDDTDDATEALLRDIVQQEPAEPTEVGPETGSSEADVETTRRKDRRGRRVVRRVTPAAERQDAEQQDVEEQAQGVPQEERAAENPAVDFESAKAEFERSPRRRRRVRGNSRSDREPRPEDYGLGHQDSRRQDLSQQAEPSADSSAQAVTAPVPQVRSDRRGRRRVVRSAQ